MGYQIVENIIPLKYALVKPINSKTKIFRGSRKD